ncbi:hypothetical protein [Labilithrix luteola]|nr:hypothetical protein [Labilithrix luteola]
MGHPRPLRKIPLNELEVEVEVDCDFDFCELDDPSRPPMLTPVVPPPDDPFARGGAYEPFFPDDETHTRATEPVAAMLDEVGPLSDPSGLAPSPLRLMARDGRRLAEMRALYARGDVEGALTLAAVIASSFPETASRAPADVLADALFAAAQAEKTRDEQSGVRFMPREPPRSIAEARASIAALSVRVIQETDDRVPRLLLAPAELMKLSLDHRAGFLLAHIDGMQTVEEILDTCAMPAGQALELIAELEAKGVIAIATR